ncbi:MAG: serine protease [Hyphomonadaceae bacterium]
MIARLFRALAAAFAVAVAAPAAAQESGENSIVRIAVILESPQGRLLAEAGSGFVVAPNLVVTSAHVVTQARQQPEFSVVIVPPGSDAALPARIVAYSALTELALLEYRGGPELDPLTISTVEPQPGDDVVALGYPDVDFQGATGEELLRGATASRTSGEIASLRDVAPTGEAIPTINHQAVISSGSSGGPLLDQCGRVIGVNTWHVRGTETRETRGVASRVPQLLDFLQNAGIEPRTTDERCLSEAERIEAERAATVQALQSQNEALAEKLATADRLTRIAIIVLIAGTAALFIAVLVLGAVLLGGRRRRSDPEPFDPPRRRGGLVGIIAGVAFASIILVAAVLLLMRAQEETRGENLSAIEQSRLI